jgi:hypothetical protein
MSTKTQDFRVEQQRSGKKKAAPGTRKAKAAAKRLTHNEAKRLDRKQGKGYALEEMGSRASRKSTRGAANRSKPDSALRLTARVRSSSPEARAQRKSGNPM